jgi:hypothetical protein
MLPPLVHLLLLPLRLAHHLHPIDRIHRNNVRIPRQKHPEKIGISITIFRNTVVRNRKKERLYELNKDITSCLSSSCWAACQSMLSLHFCCPSKPLAFWLLIRVVTAIGLIGSSGHGCFAYLPLISARTDGYASFQKKGKSLVRASSFPDGDSRESDTGARDCSLVQCVNSD